MSGADLQLLHWQVSQFLYEECALVDDRKFEEWAALLADDIQYTVPSRVDRIRRNDSDGEFLPLEMGAHFHEDKRTLRARVKKLGLERSWSSDPRTRTRMLVSNVRVRRSDTPGEVLALSNIALFRSRLSRPITMLCGRREDLLRTAENTYGFVLARRTVYLDHTLWPDVGLTTFL